MNPNGYAIRAIVTASKSGFDAQLLDIDIAARGNDVADLLKQIAYAIELHYEIAKELNEAPFARIASVPRHLEAKWDDSAATSMGVLVLSPQVAEALATALHAIRMNFTIRSMDRMAA